MSFKAFVKDNLLFESDEGLTIWKKRGNDFMFFGQFHDEMFFDRNTGKYIADRNNRIVDVSPPKNLGFDIRNFYRHLPDDEWNWSGHFEKDNRERVKTKLMKSDIEELGKMNKMSGEDYFRNNVIEVKYDLKHSPDALVTGVFQTPDLNNLEKFKNIARGTYTFPISNVEKIPHGSRNFKNFRKDAWAITQWDRRQSKKFSPREEPVIRQDRDKVNISKFNMKDLIKK